jgi:lipopolysaccharide/colanic/teichoic acid biosynthesis glycosyltransferase
VYPKIKRGLDVFFSLLLMVLTAPLTALIALLIFLQRDGGVLFIQPRPGLNGRIFRCRKFRTMRREIHPGQPDMERITGLGGLLRRFSLDELPQLWNILRGEMSFIGPRPLLPEYMEFYTREQSRRHDVRPGMTGLAQVSGRNAIDWDERLALDARYAKNLCFRTDLRIFFKTLRKLIDGDGVNCSAAATSEPFTEYAKRQRKIAHENPVYRHSGAAFLSFPPAGVSDAADARLGGVRGGFHGSPAAGH